MDFGKLQNIMGMAKMAAKIFPNMQTQMEQMTKRLSDKKIVGLAGGGSAKVTLNGMGQCTAVELDSMVLSRKGVAEDLVRTAINDAYAKLESELSAERDAMMASMGKAAASGLSELQGMLPGMGLGGGGKGPSTGGGGPKMS